MRAHRKTSQIGARFGQFLLVVEGLVKVVMRSKAGGGSGSEPLKLMTAG